MALVAGRTELGLKDTSKTVRVPGSARGRLMYYLSCVDSVLQLGDDPDIKRCVRADERCDHVHPWGRRDHSFVKGCPKSSALQGLPPSIPACMFTRCASLWMNVVPEFPTLMQLSIPCTQTYWAHSQTCNATVAASAVPNPRRSS